MDYSYLIHLCDCLQALSLLRWIEAISLPRNSHDSSYNIFYRLNIQSKIKIAVKLSTYRWFLSEYKNESGTVLKLLLFYNHTIARRDWNKIEKRNAGAGNWTKAFVSFKPVLYPHPRFRFLFFPKLSRVFFPVSYCIMQIQITMM